MVHEFGPFRYDASQRLLFRDGELVPLVPKAIDTLHVLVERRGRVVDKDELMKLVWPDAVVEEVGLARNISLLRKALGAEADSYIETIPKRGYRFAAASVAAVPVRRRWPWLVVVALGAVLVYWQFYLPSRYLPQGRGYASLAVVPFDPLSGELKQTGFSQAFNEVLVADLSKLNRVYVISPSTVRRYLWLGIGPQVMARLLGVEVILEGTAQKTGERLRITARLADVHSGKLIWAETYDQPAGDVITARAIASEVGRRLSEGFAKK